MRTLAGAPETIARSRDVADPSFVEETIRHPGGGAVAGFGDTRVSPTWANNHMALGFFDALFPNLLTFAQGQSMATILINIIEEPDFEIPESFTIELYSLTGRPVRFSM